MLRPFSFKCMGLLPCLTCFSEPNFLSILISLHISSWIRPNLLQILSAVPRSNTLKVSDNPSSSGSGILSDPYCKLQREGCLLTSNGKVAIVLVLEDIEEIEKTSDTNLVNSEGNENAHLLVKALLDDHLRFVKVMLTHVLQSEHN